MSFAAQQSCECHCISLTELQNHKHQVSLQRVLLGVLRSAAADFALALACSIGRLACC